MSERRSLVVLVVVVGLAVLAGAGILWCQKVYKTPENTFARMLSNSLSTASVTKQSVSETGPQKVTQSTRLQTSPEPRVHGVVEISQGSADQQSFVKRETITSTTTNFVRLVTVETTQKNAAGQPYDFSPVLGTWGQTPATEGDNSTSQLYGQNVAVPFVKLSANGRRQVLDQIRTENVYNVNYQTVKKVNVNGRQAYIYDVSVKPEAFIRMMKSIGQLVGVKGFDEVNSNDYKNLPDVKFTFTVDVLSRDLITVDYGNGQAESYSGAGFRSIARDPKDAISMLELQQRLQSLQR